MNKYKNYNDMYNEGGGGYNPYKQNKPSGEPEWSKVLGQIDRKKRILCGISTKDDRYGETEREIALLEERYAELKK